MSKSVKAKTKSLISITGKKGEWYTRTVVKSTHPLGSEWPLCLKEKAVMVYLLDTFNNNNDGCTCSLGVYLYSNNRVLFNVVVLKIVQKAASASRLPPKNTHASSKWIIENEDWRLLTGQHTNKVHYIFTYWIFIPIHHKLSHKWTLFVLLADRFPPSSSFQIRFYLTCNNHAKT